MTFQFFRFLRAESKDLLSNLDRFLFAPRDLMALGLMRAILGFSLAGFYAVRLVDFDLLFSEKGYITFEGAKSLFPEFYKPLVYLFVQNETLSYGLHVAFIVALIFVGLGIGGRFTNVIAYVLHVLFLNRNYAVVYGPDFLATTWLLCFCFIRTTPLPWKELLQGDWAPLARSETETELMTLIWHRLLQVQLCVVYLYGGLEKFRGQSWWDGTALWKVMGNGQYTQIDFSWLAWAPGLVALLTYFAAFWETFFPAIVWSKKAKGYILSLGLLLHGGISIMMGLVFFSFITVLGYFAFIESEDIRRWKNRFNSAV